MPPRPLRELRELLRYRRKLVESQAAERNRLLKLLETANIKLASVASDVFGDPAVGCLWVLIEGEASAEAMADLAKGQLRRKRADLILALDGRIEEHHRFLLAMQLRRLEAIEVDIATLDLRIGERLEPYCTQHALLMQIPGVDWLVAAVLIAEIGVDMSVFLSARPTRRPGPASVPAVMRVRAGRRAAGPGRATSTSALSWSAPQSPRREPRAPIGRNSLHRLKARRGALRAALAIAHKILVSAYHMLAKNLPYRDLGEACILTRSGRPEPSPTSNAASNASAIASHSNPRGHVKPAHERLFSWQRCPTNGNEKPCQSSSRRNWPNFRNSHRPHRTATPHKICSANQPRNRSEPRGLALGPSPAVFS